jgi:hypothetical protein
MVKALTIKENMYQEEPLELKSHTVKGGVLGTTEKSMTSY